MGIESPITPEPVPELVRFSRQWAGTKPPWFGWAAMVVVVLVVWGAWMACHEHIAASWRYGPFNDRVDWSISRECFWKGGETRVNLTQLWKADDDLLDPLSHLHRVVALDMTNSVMKSSDGLAALSKLPELRELVLARTEIPWMTDLPRWDATTLDHVIKLRRLEKLDLQGMTLNDRDLEKLLFLRRLESLDLSETDVTDEGLKTLANLPSLKSLYLRKTKITDEGMAILSREFPKLEIVNVEDTDVTDEGAARLSMERPEVTVENDELYDPTRP